MHSAEDPKHFITLIQEHNRIIYKVCNLYAFTVPEREDLYQEIVLQAWKAFPQFKGASKASTWLYRIALNTAISHKRSNSKKAAFIPFDTLHTQMADTYSNDDAYTALQQLIGNLPTLEKALMLLYLEDNSYDEIAAILGISTTNVGTKLGRIREKLKKQAQTILQ